ncbi:hypothetical protein ACS0TY_007478 [Phlomoides rotata]
MEKIENEKNLQVTFSKRCAGVFKKASELNTLCGAESAVVVFTPGKRAHSYGHPKELVHLEELLVRERHRKSELNHTFKP